MGAYTYVTDGIIDVVDMGGLKKFLKDLKGKKLPEYVQKNKIYASAGGNDGPEFAGIITLDEKNKTADFKGMDGWKIISYWYPLFVQFMRDVAVFVEGEILLDFESNEEGGWIEFTKGKCIIHTSQMIWQESSPEEIRPEISKLSKKLKQRLMARKV